MPALSPYLSSSSFSFLLRLVSSISVFHFLFTLSTIISISDLLLLPFLSLSSITDLVGNSEYAELPRIL